MSVPEGWMSQRGGQGTFWIQARRTAGAGAELGEVAWAWPEAGSHTLQVTWVHKLEGRWCQHPQ